MSELFELRGYPEPSDAYEKDGQYIKLAKKYHPDVSELKLHVSEAKMKQINNAFNLVKIDSLKDVVSFEKLLNNEYEEK